jgi:hypothetical protein
MPARSYGPGASARISKLLEMDNPQTTADRDAKCFSAPEQNCSSSPMSRKLALATSPI